MTIRTTFVLFLAALGLAPGLAFSASQNWNGSTTANWSDSTNWGTISAVPPGSTSATNNSDIASFLTNPANGTTTPLVIDANRNLRSLVFDTGVGSFVIGSTGGSSLLLSSGGSITLASTVAGTGLVETVNAPLILEPATATATGAYSFINNSADFTNTLLIAGNISGGTTNQTVTLTLNGPNTGNNLVSGNITNGTAAAVAVTKSGAGTWKLSGNNSYTGGTSLGGGTVVVGSSTAFGTGNVVVTNVTTLMASTDLSGANSLANTLVLGGASQTIIQGSNSIIFGGLTAHTVGTNSVRTLTVNNSALTSVSGAVRITDLSAANTLVINGTGAVNISGNIYNGGGVNPGGISSNLTYAGTNKLTLAGANVYTGVTTITDGTISINTLANAGVGIFTLATTQDSTSATVNNAAGLQVGQVLVALNVSGGNSNLALGTTIQEISGTNITLSQAAVLTTTPGAMAGFANGLGLSTSAASNLVLDGGTLQYTGAAASTNRLFTVTQNGGTLDASGTGAMTWSSTGSIAFTGSGARTLTLTGSSTEANTLAPVLGDGSGGASFLTKAGAGLWTLTRAQTFTGNMTITGGTLALSGAGSVANSSIIDIAAGTFDVTGVTSGNYAVGSSQTLRGNGMVRGAMTINGALTPGESAGKLSFENSLTLGSTAITTLEIGGSSRGLVGGYDAVDIGAGELLTYGGNLTLSMSSAIANGVYDLFSFTPGSDAGGFSSINFAGGAYIGTWTETSLGSGIWNTSAAGQSFTFSEALGDLTVVPEAGPNALLLLGLIGFIIRRRR